MRVALLLALAGCIPEGPVPTPCTPSPEVCDGMDNDCDGAVDEGVGQRTFRDADGDGFGDPRVPLLACEAPSEHVAVSGDCDDGDPQVSPVAEESCDGADSNCNGVVDDIAAGVLYNDGDGDGFGDPDQPLSSCEGVVSSSTAATDCDDANPAAFPGNPEVCNGWDDDCDGTTDLGALDSVERFEDADADGFGAESPTLACPSDPDFADVDGDCDDDDDAVHPTAFEVVDAIDNDCDGLIACFEDADGDGIGGSNIVEIAGASCDAPDVSITSDDCDDTAANVSPDHPEVCGNGIDDDCNASTEDDSDNDGDGMSCAFDCDDTQAPSDSVLYSDIAAEAGVDLVQGSGSFPCGAEAMSGAVAVADFDDDGDHDIFYPRLYLPDVLFQNNGDGTYSDVAAAMGLDHPGSSNGAVFFDADGDDDLDLYVTSLGTSGNRLYINDGSSFSEEAVARGVAHTPPGGECQLSFSASVADVDGDGDLDLHATGWEGLNGPMADRDQLWLNDGAGFFTESSALDLAGRASFTSSWADFDDDGDLDVGVASDWNRSTLWRNDGSLSFVDVTNLASVGTDENGMGSAVGDVDGDGDLDWFVTAIYDPTTPCPTNWGCTGNRLFLGDGNLGFTDATAQGVRDGAWSWGAVFFDRDNDGDLDLAVENGFPNSRWRDQFTRLFTNDGSGVFEDRACESGLASPGQGRGVVPIHHDTDGDLDLVVVHLDENLRLYRSTGAESHHWLSIDLHQPGRLNTRGIGAVVWLSAAGVPSQRRDVHLNSQFGSTQPPEAHFGLNTYGGPVDVTVVWPDGASEVFTGLSTDQFTTLTRTAP